MDQFRADVKAMLGQVEEETVEAEPIPSTPPKAEPIQPTGSGVISMMTLKNGHRGTQVKVLQWLLSQNGFDAGKIDGIFGANTKKAVKAYQEAHGLDPDGIVGRQTWKSLLE
jgi:peptidoglycan hydrolase-like protein with peptidoglycan-binding domain